MSADTAIKECSQIINNILMLLSSIENVDKSLIEEGNVLMRRAQEALALNVRNLNFSQSEEDPPGLLVYQSKGQGDSTI